jgi:ribosomal protein S18 acetylase RimI-like enzyme
MVDLPTIIAMDQEIFGVYGADEDPAVIQARLLVFPQGCVVLEEQPANEGSATFLGYLTTEKWAKLREPALNENPEQTHQPQGQILNITTLVIGTQFQQRGLGGHLIQAARAIAQGEGCNQIVLETAHAEAFYRRHGFSKIGQRQQRGIQLQIMHLHLP